MRVVPVLALALALLAAGCMGASNEPSGEDAPVVVYEVPAPADPPTFDFPPPGEDASTGPDTPLLMSRQPLARQDRDLAPPTLAFEKGSSAPYTKDTGRGVFHDAKGSVFALVEKDSKAQIVTLKGHPKWAITTGVAMGGKVDSFLLQPNARAAYERMDPRKCETWDHVGITRGTHPGQECWMISPPKDALLTRSPEGELLFFVFLGDGTVRVWEVSEKEPRERYTGKWSKEWTTFLPFWAPERVGGDGPMFLHLFVYSAKTGNMGITRWTKEDTTYIPQFHSSAKWSPGWTVFSPSIAPEKGLEYVAYNKDTDRVVYDRFNLHTRTIETLGESKWEGDRPPFGPWGFPSLRNADNEKGVLLAQKADWTVYAASFTVCKYC